MPHCKLEYSKNITNKDLSGLLIKLNKLISEKLPTDLKNFKSRIIPHDLYCVSDGTNNQSFVHLEVSILEGREKSILTSLTKILHQFLKDEFKDLIKDIPCSITVEVRVMDKDLYARESFGAI